MRCLILIVAALLLVGCNNTTPKVDLDPPAQMPTYTELVDRHNKRVEGIERFWSRTVIEMRWIDAEGNSKFEQGEGYLILDLPLHSMLTIGKVGQDRLYAGSNETYFWLFDELDADQKKLYIGRHDGQFDPALGPAHQRSPLPLKPVDLPRLLGIVQIGSEQSRQPGAATGQIVKWAGNRFMIEPPGEKVRYFFSPISARAERVELLDDQGKVVLRSSLDKPERMEKTGAAIGPYMNTRVEVETVGQQGSITLHLSGMTDEQRKVNPSVFDLSALKVKRKPDVVIPVAP